MSTDAIQALAGTDGAGATAMSLLELPPLSLYIHLPWCVRKCPYCDFNSHAVRGVLPEDDYVRALLADLDCELARAGGRQIRSVFFGGGTPSLFGASSIDRLLSAVNGIVALDDAEITLEVNPGTVERGRFADYARAGVNRISLGVQSFDPERLVTLGRIHSVDDVWRAVDELDRAGIGNFNIDLMYGLPGQDVDGAAADVRAALTAGPAHVSYYQLTIEPNTLFHRNPPSLPDDDLMVEMDIAAAEELRQAGYSRYEVSAWAQPDMRCRHNENYWCYGDYLGVGAGAHGKLTYVHDDRIERRCKQRRPADYIDGGSERLTDRSLVAGPERVFEFMLNALRLIEGFTEPVFSARTGLAAAAVRPGLHRARADGLLEQPSHGHWRASPRGKLFLNDLQARFLPGTADD